MSETAEERTKKLIQRWRGFGDKLNWTFETKILIAEFRSAEAAISEELEELKRHTSRCDLEDFRYIRRLQAKNKKLQQKLKTAEAAAREEVFKHILTLEPSAKAIPHASKKTWAGRNYMSGWNQFRSAAIRALAGEEGEG